jgi:glycosyltransferase involved in cell wall biosynthesis
MKILHLIPAYKPSNVYGGPTVAIADLCEGLVRAGHEVVVYTTSANGNVELDVDFGKAYHIHGVKVIYHRRWTKDHSHFSPGLLRRFWKTAKGFDVVHISAWWNLISMPVAWYSQRKGIPLVLSAHGSLSNYSFTHQKRWIKQCIHTLKGNSLLGRCLVHVTSEKEKVEVHQAVQDASCFVIPNLISIPKQIRIKEERNDIFHIIFLGRIHPVKNLGFFLEVLDHAFEFGYDFKIFGQGGESYVHSLKELQRSDHRVSWMDQIHDEDKWKQLAEADLLVLPSETENFGNVVVEALSQGTPVLISDQVGLKDFVSEHHLGWVEELNVKTWRSRLIDIWNDGEARNRIRNVAPTVISEKFRSETLMKQYEDLYQYALKI